MIRTRFDRGIVCVLDSRLITKDYGAEFVKYLPPASRASKWNRVEKFWHGESEPSAEALPDTAKNGTGAKEKAKK